LENEKSNEEQKVKYNIWYKNQMSQDRAMLKKHKREAQNEIKQAISNGKRQISHETGKTSQKTESSIIALQE